jgi:hypothetical protein
MIVEGYHLIRAGTLVLGGCAGVAWEGGFRGGLWGSNH